ncbi:MAG TPA: cytochrome c, partial [Armatimonadota bacterium]|nr:cytochrome c [Armatimonadota bacterium]
VAANASVTEVYAQKCQNCHGAQGQGGRGGPTLASASGDPDAEVRAVIHDGRRNMPAFKGQLSDAQITALVGHVKGLGGGK